MCFHTFSMHNNLCLVQHNKADRDWQVRMQSHLPYLDRKTVSIGFTTGSQPAMNFTVKLMCHSYSCHIEQVTCSGQKCECFWWTMVCSFCWDPSFGTYLLNITILGKGMKTNYSVELKLPYIKWNITTGWMSLSLKGTSHLKTYFVKQVEELKWKALNWGFCH